MNDDNVIRAVDQIKFFGSVVSTEGISNQAKNKANEYIEKLIDGLGSSVNDTTAALSDIII